MKRRLRGHQHGKLCKKDRETLRMSFLLCIIQRTLRHRLQHTILMPASICRRRRERDCQEGILQSTFHTSYDATLKMYAYYHPMPTLQPPYFTRDKVSMYDSLVKKRGILIFQTSFRVIASRRARCRKRDLRYIPVVYKTEQSKSSDFWPSVNFV